LSAEASGEGGDLSSEFWISQFIIYQTMQTWYFQLFTFQIPAFAGMTIRGFRKRKRRGTPYLILMMCRAAFLQPASIVISAEAEIRIETSSTVSSMYNMAPAMGKLSSEFCIVHTLPLKL